MKMHVLWDFTELCLVNIAEYLNLHVYAHTDTHTQNYNYNKKVGQIDFEYCISWPIRHTVIFSLEILEKNNDECILILVIYWKKTGLLYTKISNHNIIYSS